MDGFLRLDEITIRVTRVRSINSHLAIRQRSKLTDMAVAPDPANSETANEYRVMISDCAYNHVRLHKCVRAFILFPVHFASYFRSAFLRSGFHSCPHLCIILPLHSFNYHQLAPAFYMAISSKLYTITMLIVGSWIVHLTPIPYLP